jgi:uncharacterized protein (TIGR02452 family)
MKHRHRHVAKIILQCSNASQPQVADYYATHEKLRDPLYTHNMIYSPGVSFFREEPSYTLFEHPFEVSVITSAAPNAGVSEERCLIEKSFE